MEIYSEIRHFQTIRARKLTFLEKVHHPLPVMCHMSHVTYHMSHVTCHMSQEGTVLQNTEQRE